MKKILPLLILFIPISFTLCSTYSVKTDVETDNISLVKNPGLIFRLAKSRNITVNDLANNTKNWLAAYKSGNNVSVIGDASKNLIYSQSSLDRFYQLADEANYLKYKSIGTVNSYLRKNEADLKRIISSNNLDGLIIYEIYTVISPAMQFMDFDSVIAIVDRNLIPVYQDHQTDSFESTHMMAMRMKNSLLDKISERLIEKLQNLDIIGDPGKQDDIDTSPSNALSADTDKQIQIIEEDAKTDIDETAKTEEAVEDKKEDKKEEKKEEKKEKAAENK